MLLIAKIFMPKRKNLFDDSGLITTLVLVAIGVGLLAYFHVDVRALVGVVIRWLGTFFDAIRP